MDKVYNYVPTFINFLFLITFIIFIYMRTTSLAGVDIEGKDIANGLTKLNLTGDIKQAFSKEKTSRFIFIGAVILLFLTYIFYFFLDYDTEGEEGVSNFTRLLFIWGSLYIIVYLINFLINRVTLSAELFLRIFFITSVCFWFITGSTYVAISLVPSLVEIFENTIGFTWIKTFSNAEEKLKIIKSRTYPSFDIPSEILITKFSQENFNDMFEGLLQKQIDANNLPEQANEVMLDFFIDVNEGNLKKKHEVKDTLFQLVKIKNKVGHMVWIYVSSLVAMLVTLISMNENIIN